MCTGVLVFPSKYETTLTPEHLEVVSSWASEDYNHSTSAACTGQWKSMWLPASPSIASTQQYHYPNDKHLPTWHKQFNSECNTDQKALLLSRTTRWQFRLLNPHHLRNCLQQTIEATALSQYIRKSTGITGGESLSCWSLMKINGETIQGLHQHTDMGRKEGTTLWIQVFKAAPPTGQGRALSHDRRDQQEFTQDCKEKHREKVPSKEDFSSTSLSWAYILSRLVQLTGWPPYTECWFFSPPLKA